MISSESVPSEARVVSAPPSDFSPQDQTVFERAKSKVLHHGKFLDREDVPYHRRGFVIRQFDPSKSLLVPDPPFTHVKVSWENKTRFFKAVADQVSMKETAHTYSARPVASTKDGLKRYIFSEIFDVKITPRDLSTKEQSVLEDAIETPHTERVPLSEGFESLLDLLGFGGVEPVGTFSTFGNTYIKYRDNYYSVFLHIGQPRVTERKYN
jgi:hypothetical protein